jgi:formylglycine-generating enzyme required for sulfatase activity
MGSDASGVQGPIHQVTLSPYFIDRTEVTNAQYAECVAAGVCLPPPSSAAYDGSAYYGEAAYADYPVIYVGWEAANAYCRWRGARLPTEAEWEMAACWNPTTGVKTVYPWGDEWDAARLNLCDSSCLLSQFADPDHSDGWPQMAPVGSFPQGASPLGALDMAGNVAEWVTDWFNPAYYAVSPSENPTGPAEGTLRVVRGGAWGINDTRLFTCTARSRFAPTSISAGLGFRCAQSAE